MLSIKRGSRRIVFLTETRAYKIPNFLARWPSFLAGFLENLNERYWWSADGSRKRDPREPWRYPGLAEIFYADRFGLLVVMRRAQQCEQYPEREVNDLIANNRNLRYTTDNKPANLGYVDGKLVFVDYGYYGGLADCYLGS